MPKSFLKNKELTTKKNKINEKNQTLIVEFYFTLQAEIAIVCKIVQLNEIHT